jgi:pimeloyl-ACP methyl ester carboxylesterase
VIFIHGYLGLPQKTWGQLLGQFPNFVAQDLQGSTWDVFSIGFQAPSLHDLTGRWWQNDFSPIPMAEQLNGFLVSEPLAPYQKLALVTHSLGGLIAQRALVDSSELSGRVSHLFLFACPNLGLLIARLLLGFSRPSRNLAQGSDFIKDLRKRWDERFGRDLPFALYAIVGELDEFVPPLSGFGPFADSSRRVVLGNHAELVKPKSIEFGRFPTWSFAAWRCE